MQADVAEEHLPHRQLDIVRHADTADDRARPGGAQRLQHRLGHPDALQDGVGADSVGELGDPGDPGVAALGDDVGRPELLGQPLPRLVSAHRDDPLGAELASGEHAGEPDGAVADHRHGHPRLDLGRDGRVPPGRHHVGQR